MKIIMKTYLRIAYSLILIVVVGLASSFAQPKPGLNRDEVALVKESLKGIPASQYHIKLIEADGKGGAIEKTYGKMDWKTIEAGKAASGILLTPYINLNKIRLNRLQIIGPGCFDIIWSKNLQEALERIKGLDRLIVKRQ
ncbi:hypothetical protein [Spirosoma aerophilum]